VGSPQDGRYEEWRITDPDGMVFEIAEGGWEAGGEKRLPAVRYVGIRTADPEWLADFYQSALPIKEIRRVAAPNGQPSAIFLSAGTTALGLLKSFEGAKVGLERIGFQVPSVDVIKERIQKAPSFLYPGEPEIAVLKVPPGELAESFYLKDPDGNLVELSEKGWVL
jgi:catechol 2,3-dioxygenase-like lactoylglutathione lyase family enzyme